MKGYPIVQYKGDAIFIPAGTPHQVQNLFGCIKAAGDFVCPENVERCIERMKEFRLLDTTYSNKAEILQIKILYHTIRVVIDELNPFNY